MKECGSVGDGVFLAVICNADIVGRKPWHQSEISFEMIDC
jgi:hypothetical protein